MSGRQSIYIDSSQSEPRSRQSLDVRFWLLSFLLLIVTTILAAVAYMSRWSLNSTGWTLLAGLLALSIIVSVGVILQSRQGGNDETIVPLSELFSEHHTPFLITKDEKPVAANRAYLKLFGENFEQDVKSSSQIPSILQLIAGDTDKASRTLYQLHNLPDHCSPEVKSLMRLGRKSQGERDIIPFDLRVSGLGSSKLWEIIEKPHEQDKAYFHNVPIGLMSFSADGAVIDMNEALRSWFGDSLGHIDEENGVWLKDIIDDPEILLGDTPKVGMNIRAEARLKTAEVGAVPVAIKAKWLELADESLLAVCALHGHSNITTVSYTHLTLPTILLV